MPYYVIKLRNGGYEMDKVGRGSGVSTRAGVFIFDNRVQLEKEYPLAEGVICFFRYKKEADIYANTIQVSSKEKLNPCPFCGSPKTTLNVRCSIISEPRNYSRITAQVCCSSCKAKGPEAVGYTTEMPFPLNGVKWTTQAETEYRAVLKWNSVQNLSQTN